MNAVAFLRVATIAVLLLLTAAGTSSPSGQTGQSSGAGVSWAKVDRPSYAFSSPPNWSVQDANASGSSTTNASDPSSPRAFTVSFTPGFVNHSEILNQCAGVD